MKKISGIILKCLLGLIALILVLMVSVPLIFKEKIKVKVEQVINESVNVRVDFNDYKLGFFRDFPNLTFSLDDVTVAGTGKFETDTLASFRSLNMVFNLSSLFRSSGYEIKSIKLQDAAVKAVVLKDGSVNWDIMKESEEPESEEASSSSGMKFLLKNVDILNSSVAYVDYSSDMQFFMNELNANMKGDMTLAETNLLVTLNSNDVTFIMEGMKYINKAVADAKVNLNANLDSMKFNLQDNYISLNDLKLVFEGMVAMPGDDIETDLTFNGDQISLKSLMSLIPTAYMEDYKDLKTSGEISLSGSAIGVYSDADSTLPDITLDLKVNNGMISYPALPEQIKNINIKSNVFVDGKDLDKTIVSVDGFHMELAGNPFDFSLLLKTPVSDPDIKASMTGKIDLSALTKAIPVDGIALSGLIDMSVRLAGRMSMIEKEQYDKFAASGNMNINNMLVSMTGYPEIKISNAAFEFTPAYAEMKPGSLIVGSRSDFALSGRLENYIPYVFSNDVIKGNLSLHSKLVDLTDIMSKMASDTTSVTDTASLTIIRIPKNVEFDFNALIDKFVYDKVNATNMKGHLIVKNGVLSLKETGMNMLGGTMVMNADYDTRDSLKPRVTADLKVENLGIKDAFTTFNVVQKLVPASKGIDGRVGVRLTYSSLLGSDFMPVIQSISGSGKLQSKEVTLVESPVYNAMKGVLKLGSGVSNTFKDINISFNIKEGRIYVDPFDVKAGNMKMNVSGDQGIDQSLNYIVKTQIPRADLGSSVNNLIENLSAQASKFGVAFTPSDVIKVNVKVSGTFSKPVVSPVFGDSSSDKTSGVAETAKSVISETVDSKIDMTKEKAKEAAREEGDKLVKEAEERAQQLRDEATKVAEKIRQEAATRAQKVISEAESRGALAKAAAQKAADSINKEADKRATQVVKEADEKALKIVDEAKAKREELLNKI